MGISRNRGVIMGNTDVRAVDDLDGASVAVKIARTVYAPGHAVTLTCDDNAWPNQTAWLDPRSARKLARDLLDLADEAELLNLEGEDAEMACTVCAQPVRRSFGASTWQHREAAAALACPATARIMARVAAGA
jgi:hypothetical protein